MYEVDSMSWLRHSAGTCAKMWWQPPLKVTFDVAVALSFGLLLARSCWQVSLCHQAAETACRSYRFVTA